MKENKMLPFEHVIECAVPIKFAWQFWTDVRNWRLDSDVDAVELSGPFAAGSAGATLTHSMGRIEWRIFRSRKKEKLSWKFLPWALLFTFAGILKILETVRG